MFAVLGLRVVVVVLLAVVVMVVVLYHYISGSKNRECTLVAPQSMAVFVYHVRVLCAV